MTYFDELAEKAGDDQWWKWLKLALCAKEEIAAFVARERNGGGVKEVVGWTTGSFNFCLRVAFNDDGPDAMIRFPKPGHTIFLEEKVTKEVQVIKFLHERTTIPVPRLISWGLTKDSPQGLGPFLISDFVEGVDLSDILKDPAADPRRLYLNPKIDEATLDTVFEQIADFMLQLFQFNFTRIGAISKQSNTWSVTERPLTYSMNELATTAFFPVDEFPSSSFTSARDYFTFLNHELWTHLKIQRNLCKNKRNAQDRYVALCLYTQLLDKYTTDNNGPFKLFCEDLRPQNMLVDPKTLRITAVLDLEFTNAMPSQYACEPPWWLLLAGPDSYLYRGHSIEQFTTTYEPRLNQFLHAMQRAEEARGLQGKKGLSGLMRESWYSKRFWFNFAGRKPLDVDVLFEKTLNEDGAGIEAVDAKALAELGSFLEMKMMQLNAYDDECRTQLD